MCIECSELFDYSLISRRHRWVQAKMCDRCAPSDDLEHEAIYIKYQNTKVMRKYLEGMRRGRSTETEKGNGSGGREASCGTRMNLRIMAGLIQVEQLVHSSLIPVALVISIGSSKSPTKRRAIQL